MREKIFIGVFGFMVGWLFTIYIAGRFDTFGIAANWQQVAKSCFSAADVQGNIIDRLAISKEIAETKLPTGAEVKNDKRKN